MPSRYTQSVDPAAENNAHSLALQLIGSNRRVLELGAAAGHVTRALVERRCRVTAIEYEAEAARDLEGIAERVVQGDLDDPSVFDGLPDDYDIVLCGDVLEHLSDPTAALARAVRLLAPGGRIVVSVPNVAHVDVRLSLVQGHWRYRDQGLLDRTHIRFFTVETVQEMIRDVGFVITDLRRTVVPAFGTELDVDRSLVPEGLLSAILADPEAETYQFVFAAARDDSEHHLEVLARERTDLAHDVRRLERKLAGLQQEHAQFVDRHDVLAGQWQAHFDNSRREVDEARAETAALRAELEQLRADAGGP